MSATWQVRCGDALTLLREMPGESVRCVVTSPPYWGLRDYGVAGQLGLERTPDEYVAAMVAVFAEVRRVLAKDGTLWLNLGDSYVASPNSGTGWDSSTLTLPHGRPSSAPIAQMASMRRGREFPQLKPKDLVGIPWRVAFALQADGWWLRSDIIWAKPNPMPESVTDRLTKAHEYLFLLAKSQRYYYDAEAIAVPVALATIERLAQPTLAEQEGSSRVPGKTNGNMKAVAPRFGGTKYGDNSAEERRTKSGNEYELTERRNARTVWTIATRPFSEAHFATFPTALVEPCVKAGSAPGDTVLDPFAGSGTVGVVALRLGRSFVGLELNPAYCEMARRRITDDAPLLNSGPA